LSDEECKKIFENIKDDFNSKSRTLYEDLFFGSKKYKKWSGYSIGYWIIKKVRVRYPDKSWEELMQLNLEVISNLATFAKK
jgi:uncharacterized protein YjaZ